MIPPQSMLTIKNQAEKQLILFLAIVTLFTACSPRGVRLLWEGQRLLDAGQYQAAVEKLRSATVLLGGTNAQAYNYLGLACHHAGLFGEAEKAYQRALALGPDLAEARFNLGCLYLSQNKLGQAKSELTAFTLRRSTSTAGWLKLGTAQLHARELVSAEKSFSEAIRLDPHNAEGLTDLGLVRLQRGHTPEAAQFFAQALRAQPGYQPALLNWAIVAQENLRDPNLALQKYREYLALKPVPENAASVASIVHQLELELAPPLQSVTTNVVAQPNTNRAKSSFEIAHPPAPAKASVPETARSVGAAKVEPGTNVPKLTATSNVVKSATPPASPPVDTNFELVKLVQEPVFKTAADVTSSPARIEPPQVEKLVVTSTPPAVAPVSKSVKRGFFQRINPMNLFSGQDKAGSPQGQTPKELSLAAVEPESVSVLAPASDSSAGTSPPPRYAYRSPAKPEPGSHSEAERLFAQGLQAQQGQRLSEAIQAYRRATLMDPGYFDAYYNLGLVATESGSLPTSLGAYETALAIRPESLDARYNFALALKQANYPIDAANELERTLALHPNDSRAHLALGNLYAQQLGQPVKAREHYLKVLETDPRNPQAAAVRYWLTDNPK